MNALNLRTLTVVSVLVTHLTARSTTTELSALLEAGVPVGTDLSVVQFGAVHVAHRIAGALSGRVLDEAEAARCLLDAVQTDDHSLDLTALGEELVDLLLGRVERQVANVQGGRLEQRSRLFIFGALEFSSGGEGERAMSRMKT